MKKKDAGFTLVELVVIMGMLAIFIGLFAYNISSISGYTAKECYKKISSAITENKIKALSKAANTGDIYLQIYQDTAKDRVYVRTITNATTASPDEGGTIKITKRGGVKITYEIDGVSTPQPATQGDPLNICFNRSTGAIMAISPDNTTHKVTTPVNTESKIKCINIVGKTRSYKIELVPRTGKVIMTGR